MARSRTHGRHEISDRSWDRPPGYDTMSREQPPATRPRIARPRRGGVCDVCAQDARRCECPDGPSI